MTKTKKKSRKTIRFKDDLATSFKGEKAEEYLYRVEDTGELLTVVMSYGEMLQREEAGGFLKISEKSYARRALKEELERDEIIPRKSSGVRTRAKWPMKTALDGVNPNQVGELRRHWKESGVTGCDVTPEGDIIYESRGARRSDHESRGIFDKSGGYGDAMPKNL